MASNEHRLLSLLATGGSRLSPALLSWVRRWISKRFVIAAAVLTVVAMCPSIALANSYTGLLYRGTLSITSGDHSESGGFVYGSDSWMAPADVQFNGFAYTSGTFSSLSDNSVGGVSAGFGGGGSAAQPTILFPWTDDCSITNSGHFWTNTSGSTLAGTSGQQTCDTAGSTAGWNYANSELDNTNPGTNPESTYQTLWLTVFCQAATCYYDPSKEWGAGGASVTNLSGSFVDPNNQPTGSVSWGSVVRAGAWYQTDDGGVTLDLSASDPAGVCDMYASLTGASSVTSGVIGNQSPAVADPGGEIGEEFGNGTDPCSAGVADAGTWTLPGGLPSGSYNATLAAANPGNYQAQGFTANGSPQLATSNGGIDIDDSPPRVTWANAPTGWTSRTSEQVDVTVGPSGISSVVCTDNGENVLATLMSGSPAGAGTTVWSVPMDTTGANDVDCLANNGDVNEPLGGSSSQTFDVDATTPVVSFSDNGYAEYSWTSQTQVIAVAATGGPSGIYSVACSVDGAANQQLAAPSGGSVVLSSDGLHTVTCTATSNTGVQGSATYSVNIDTEQPTLTFLVDGTPPSGAWLSGTPVVSVIGGEVGGILSGLDSITCSVDGGSPFALLGINAGTDYTGSFELDRNGADRVSCIGTTVAGTVQGTPTTATVNVDNPNYAPNPSALIDNGSDAYSQGPSQSQWYVTPQPVTITADNTGGGAPIAAIACRGALSGTWPISTLNTDSKGGEQITVTVPAPGGDLSCTAEDSAGNVYVLGSYKFEIDDTPPKGYFVARSRWPEPDEIEIHATDNGGSGVALVKVYGQSPDVDGGKPQLVGDARYDPSAGAYVVTIPDGVAPWVAGSWKFYANLSDVAGNQGEVTADAHGSTEDLTLPLRENTAVTATAERASASPEAAIPAALAAVAALPNGPKKGGTGVHATRSLSALASAASKRPPSSASNRLTVRYGSALTVSGMLRDVTHHGVPISGASIVFYEQLAGASSYMRVGSARTNSDGLYRYKVKPGASRTLFVMYRGSDLLRPAASELLEESRGSVTLVASSVHAGGQLRISGQVLGGHIPPGGLEVTIDYRQLGAPGSGTLGTVHTDNRGHYRFSQYFSPGTHGLSYELWAVVPRGQSKWPYLGARTPSVIRPVS